jgi:hypothetical protein
MEEKKNENQMAFEDASCVGVGIKEKKKISQNGDPTSNKRAVRVR